MRDISKLTAVDILSATSPEQLYTGNNVDAELEYRKLSSLWHPDRNQTADPHVFAQISTLYKKALEKIHAGTWHVPGLLTFNDLKGKKFEVRYKKHRTFELGDMYIGDYTVTYMIHKDAADLFANAKRAIKSFKFANDKMRGEVERYLPTIRAENESADRLILAVTKSPDLFLLGDVLDYLKGKTDPKHVAWITSSIYNIACYLKYAGITHNSIGLDTYFISPQHHTGALLGGWWYSSPVNDRLKAVPARTITYAPHDLTSKKIADHRIDLELIKATARELLGDGGGSKLLADPQIPNALLNWARTASSSDAVNEYRIWYETVLTDSFGERRFTKLDIKSSDIYKE